MDGTIKSEDQAGYNPGKKAKANPDYSASAVNLVTDTPKELWGLDKLEALCRDATDIEAGLEKTPEYQALQIVNRKIAALQAEIKKLIESQGSYQNTETGQYALKQRRVSFTYSPELVKANLPKFACALIEERVNEKALDGLVKGGLINNEQVASCVGETKETYAFIIKV
jgi:hypothetical protein